MFHAQDILQHVIKAWWKVARQKAGKTLPVFFFVNVEHNNITTKPQAKNDFQSYPRRETAASAGKRCRHFLNHLFSGFEN